MLRRIRNRAFALCAAVILTVVQMPPVYAAAAAGNSSPQANGFQMNGSTLVKYTGTDKSVSIPASVKKIGDAAFQGNTTMEKVKIPKGVEEICYSAFADCTGLKTVEMPDSVVTIGNSAFSNCSQLINMNFGSGLSSLGIGVFAGCDSLEEITIHKDNSAFTLSGGALYNIDKTVLYQVFAGRKGDSYSMPSTVTQVQPYAFWGCDSLKTIYISDHMEEISEYAFSNCKSLQSIQIPYSVKSIGLKAFSDCVNLRKTIIGPTVAHIHETAFDGCINLYIEAEEDTVADQFAKEHDLVKTDQAEYEDTGSDDKETINSAINNLIPPVTAPVNREGLLADTYIVGNRAVLFIDNAKAVVRDGAEERPQEPVETPSEDAEVQNPDNEQPTVAVPPATKGFSIPKLKIVDSKRIANQAYYKDSGLLSYEIPAGVEALGEFSFARSGLKEIVIPRSVQKIDYAAFYHCDDLSQVTIPSSVTQIAAKAFEKTAWLENWKNESGSDFLVVGDNILLAYRGTSRRVEIPEGVKSIAPEVFEGHKEITEIHLPDSLQAVGEKAFADCSALERITGGTSLKAIRDRAFYNCPVKTVRIPATVTEIGAGAFAAPDCNMTAAERTVVFHGKELPAVTYEASAGRLSDASARSLALEGIGTAVLLEGAGEFENTVLDAQKPGFKGLICEVEDEEKRELTCVKTTLSKEELQNFVIPSDIYIYDSRYTLNHSDQIEKLTVDKDRAFTYEGKILFSIDCDLFPEDSLFSAKLEGNNSEYYIRIRNEEQAADKIKTAYEAVYKQPLEEDAFGFEMEMIDAESTLSIQKLGKQLFKATFPVPEQLDGKTFRFVCLDSDGQLESIDYTLSEENETLYMTFELNHFSIFGFYVTGEVPEGADRTLATGGMDESPDTGDGIHPVVFLMAGAVFLTIALLFVGNRKKSSGIS